MNHEMEEHCGSCPQDTVDAAPCDTSRTEREAPVPDAAEGELEERVRQDCRRSCRRNLFVELLKTVAKIAGVILAAMGLSSFGEED